MASRNDRDRRIDPRRTLATQSSIPSRHARASNHRQHSRSRSARRPADPRADDADRSQARMAARRATTRACAKSRSARSFRRGCCRSSPTPRKSSPSRKTLPGLTVSVLVPNLKGAERAIDADADVMLLPLSASHAHSLANLRKTPDEVIDEIARIRELRDARGSACLIEVGHQHRVRLHDPGARRARRGVAAARARARGRRRARRTRRHRRLRRSASGRDVVRAGVRHRRRSHRMRTLPRHARTRPRQRVRGVADRASRDSTPAWAASAAARTRRAQAATSRPRMSPTCSRSMGVETRSRLRPPDRAARAARAVARRRNPARNAVARRFAENDDARRSGCARMTTMARRRDA